MQSSQHWKRDHTSSPLNGSAARGVLVQREMGPEFVVVDRIRAEHLAQVRFAEHDEVIQSFPANRADQPLDMSILPRGTEGGGTIANAHRAEASAEGEILCGVAIADQV